MIRLYEKGVLYIQTQLKERRNCLKKKERKIIIGVLIFYNKLLCDIY